MSRANAREVALSVAADGMRWVIGAGGADAAAGLPERLGLPAIHAAQDGLVADLDVVADALYGRS
jgi:acyl-CoA dehydrogenase